MPSLNSVPQVVSNIHYVARLKTTCTLTDVKQSDLEESL